MPDLTARDLHARNLPGPSWAASARRFAAQAVAVGVLAGAVWQGLSLQGWNGREPLTPGVPAAAADVATLAADVTFALLGLLGGGLLGSRICRWLAGPDAMAGWWVVLGGSAFAAGIAWLVGTALGLIADRLSETAAVAEVTSLVAFLAWPLGCATVVLVVSVTTALRNPVHRE